MTPPGDAAMRALDRMTITHLDLPLRRVFTTAAGSLRSRSVIIVETERSGHVGYGEAAPFPGHSRDSIDAAWGTLEAHLPALLADPRHHAGLSLTAAAALDQALAELDAKAGGVPLWQHLGGSPDGVVAGWVASGGDSAETIAAAHRGWDMGYKAVKVKIAPGRALTIALGMTDLLGDMAAGADANGSFAAASPELRAVDEVGLAYLEQPFPAGARNELATFSSDAATPIALDESVPDLPHLQEAVERRAAAIVVVKAGHLGTSHTADAMKAALLGGITPRIGGLVETGVGRAHAVALATIHPDGPAPDLVAGGYFEAEPAEQSFSLREGRAHPNPGAGTGIVLDAEVVARYSVRSMTVR